jgi:hypothetical protein
MHFLKVVTPNENQNKNIPLSSSSASLHKNNNGEEEEEEEDEDDFFEENSEKSRRTSLPNDENELENSVVHSDSSNNRSGEDSLNPGIFQENTPEGGSLKDHQDDKEIILQDKNLKLPKMDNFFIFSEEIHLGENPSKFSPSSKAHIMENIQRILSSLTVVQTIPNESEGNFKQFIQKAEERKSKVDLEKDIEQFRSFQEFQSMKRGGGTQSKISEDELLSEYFEFKEFQDFLRFDEFQQWKRSNRKQS